MLIEGKKRRRKRNKKKRKSKNTHGAFPLIELNLIVIKEKSHIMRSLINSLNISLNFIRMKTQPALIVSLNK